MLQSAVDQLFDDQFVLTSNMPVIQRREQMLDIQTDPITESMDFPRCRIINRYQTSRRLSFGTCSSLIWLSV